MLHLRHRWIRGIIIRIWVISFRLVPYSPRVSREQLTPSCWLSIGFVHADLKATMPVVKAKTPGPVLALVLLFFSACDMQTRVLYHPGQVSVAEVQQYSLSNEMQMWPIEGKTYQGIVSRNSPTTFRGTVIVFHGNRGPAVLRTCYVDALQVRGYRVVLAEYPGYGGRPGELSEKSLVTDARRTATRAVSDFGRPLYLWGESLGCGVASALAADGAIRPKGVIMLTPWDSLINEGKAKTPWLPVQLLLQDKYDNVANLSHYKGPVAVIMCRKDQVIPNKLTEQLYASLSSPKRLWIFEGAGHDDWPDIPELHWWDEVMDFLNS